DRLPDLPARRRRDAVVRAARLSQGRDRQVTRHAARLALLLLALFAATFASAQVAPDPAAAPASSPGVQLSVNLGGDSQEEDVGSAIQVLLLMTLLTLGPSIVVLMTSFTRIIIVLGFVRTALGVHQAPSNQLLIGLGLVITFFIMQPVFEDVNTNALQPLFAKEITT